jgi:hypothetical protein
LRWIKKNEVWKEVYELARDYLFSSLLLDCGFPSSQDLNTLAHECFREAIAKFRTLNPNMRFVS